MKNILVTGGTSYIGKHCIAELLKKEYNVRTTVRDIKKAESVRIGNTCLHASEVTTYERVFKNGHHGTSGSLHVP